MSSAFTTITLKRSIFEYLDWLRKRVFVKTIQKRTGREEKESSWTTLMIALVEYAIKGLRAEGYSDLADVLEAKFRQIRQKDRYVLRGWGRVDISEIWRQ